MIVYLHCSEKPELGLGPSTKPDIQFRQGFAAVDTKEFPDYQAWIDHDGNPFGILDLGSNEELMVAPEAPGAKTCDVCGESFKEPGFTSHMKKHARVALG